MKLISVTKIDKRQDGPTLIVATAIIMIEAEDESSTWLTLTTGEKFLVTELAQDIAEAIGVIEVIA